MPQGIYERRYTNCPYCGMGLSMQAVNPHIRAAHPGQPEVASATARAVAARVPKGSTYTCDTCGQQVGAAGRGSHERRHRREGQFDGNEIQPMTPKRSYTKSNWTVTLTNGSKQIAAKISNDIAKRIIGMLV